MRSDDLPAVVRKHQAALRAAWNTALISVALIGAGVFAAYLTPGLHWPQARWPRWLFLLLCLYVICWGGCFLYQRHKRR